MEATNAPAETTQVSAPVGGATDATALSETTQASTGGGDLYTPQDGDTLFSKAGEPTVPVSEDPAEKATEGFYEGKYKTREDFEKAHKELETLLRNRGSLPPEKYDVETAFKEAGITPEDRNDPEAAKRYEEFETALRDQGFNQKQLNWLTRFGNQWLRDQMQRFGPQVDLDAERAALTKEWGADTQRNADEVKTWVQANLPPALLNKPLLVTAEGWKFLQGLMKQQRGPVPIQSTAQAKPATDIEAELEKLMMSEPYRNSLNPHHEETQSRAKDMLRQLQSRRK